jgi:hypothetical protein
VHVHDAIGSMGVLEDRAHIHAVCAVAGDQLIEVGLSTAALRARVVAPPLDELTKGLLDLFAAKHWSEKPLVIAVKIGALEQLLADSFEAGNNVIERQFEVISRGVV